MAELAMIAKIPGVASAVLGDLAGAFHDAIRESDGEAVAAVTGFISTSLTQAGEHLGLGALSRVTLSGGTRACLIVLRGSSTITAFVEPAGSLTAVERVLDPTSGVRG